MIQASWLLIQCTFYSITGQRYFMCDLEGGPLLETPLRNLLLIPIRGIDYTQPPPFGDAILNESHVHTHQITCDGNNTWIRASFE